MTVSHSVETPFAPIAAFKPDAKLATLVLQDSSAFVGVSFGASNSVSGECVFVTGMSGYTETLTDPSYCGQILVLTYPLIGNYGIPDFTRDLNDLLLHFESDHIRISALVVAHYSFNFSHYLATSSLSDWLVKNSIPAIYGIDTRALTKKIRTGGVLLGKLLFDGIFILI